MKTKYLKVLNPQGESEGVIVFNERVSFAHRIEISELLRQNGYKLIDITKEEYNKTEKKFDI